MSGNPLLNMMGGNNPMAAMMNGPLGQIINIAKSGKGNPMQMIQQFAGQNPQMQQVMQMVSGHSQSEVNDMIANIAKERGVDLNQLAAQMGMPENARKLYGIE